MNAFWTAADQAIVEFFNPLAKEPAVRAPVRNEWPLHRLDHAVYVASAYLVFVLLSMAFKGKTAGTEAKKEKEPKSSFIFVAMALYNATQVLLCGWMVYASLAEHRRRGLSLVCNRHDLSEDRMAFVLHIFYLSKVLDFADTVFMIVRSKWRQVSFLHVYHHTSIFLVYWLNTNVAYDSDIYFTIVLNGVIHFIMYGYYFATSFDVKVPVFIKKSITNSQLLQFCCMELQGAYLVLMGCEFPNRVVIMYMIYIATMLGLFLDFKRRTYKEASKAKAAKKQAADGDSTAASESEVIKKKDK